MKFFGVLMILAGVGAIYWFAIKGKTFGQLEQDISQSSIASSPTSASKATSTGSTNIISQARGVGEKRAVP